MRASRWIHGGLALCLWLAALPAWAVGTPIPSAPTRWVTDEAGFLSAATRQQLDARLEAYEKANKHQVIVWIGKTTGGVPIEDWAVRAFEAWKVGRKGIDDGVVLFLMVEDRKLRIEVGYGLEGTVPDAMASRIINDHIVPAIRAGDRDAAVTAGIDALLETIGGADPGRPATRRIMTDAEAGVDHRIVTGGGGILQTIFYGIIALLVLAFVITHPSLALWLLLNIATSGRSSGGFSSGGFGGGGGGFSGGGGRSGGGGASGSW